MNSSKQLAKHLKEIHFGGNWTLSNLKDQLSDISWEEALKKPHSLNSIATLNFHINYFIKALIDVLEGRKLDSKDELSFDHPEINNQADWNNMLTEIWKDAELCIQLVEEFPNERLSEVFTDEKYGNYYRNILGIIEHSHYHLGQIALIKKLIKE